MNCDISESIKDQSAIFGCYGPI